MAANNEETRIETWLESLTSPESKRHEAAAHQIAKTPAFDPRVVDLLKQIASSDSKKYARDAAKDALQKISEAHFVQGNAIRSFLEELRVGKAVPAAFTVAASSRTAQPPASQPAPAQADAQQPNFAYASPAAQKTATAQAGAPQQKDTSAISNFQEAAPSKPATPPPPPKPAAPPVPFDQWLLSERNIKLALYSGGLLLLLAGLIFVGVNWAYLPGIAKLGVTLGVTLAMYAGGVLLFKRPSLKIGGTALLAIASGFLPLNFVVTQLYITGELVSNETMWFVASLVCGGVYLLTTLWSRNNLFTVFTIVAALSAVTALTVLLDFDTANMSLGFAETALVILLVSYWTATAARFEFMSRALRLGAHILAPLVFGLAIIAWTGSSARFTDSGNGMVALGAASLIGGFYVLEDWRSRLSYARWCAAFAFGIVAVLLCTELGLSSIQSGLVLKMLAAIYLVLGRYLQRGKKLEIGLPLYIVSALLAVLVTVQATLVYVRTPEHLGLALVGDVGLLALAAYLFRRVEFAYGAVWLALVPAFIYGDRYLPGLTERGLSFGMMLLAYTAVGFWLAPRNLKWAQPFLTAAAFLTLLVPVMVSQSYFWMTVALAVIAGLYAVMAVRLNLAWLVLPAIAAVNFAIICAALWFGITGIALARVIAFAFCAWGAVLYVAGRGAGELRLPEWARHIGLGAVVNFALAGLIAAYLALDELWLNGFNSARFGWTVLGMVGLLALTAFLYRHLVLLYAAAWLFIVPAYVLAKSFLADQTQVALVLGALMLAYLGAGYFLGRERIPKRRYVGAVGAFLSGAAILSVVIPVVLNPNYPVLTGALLGIALAYTLVAVWLRWHWLTLAALAALNLAMVTGILSVFTEILDIQRAGAVAFAALGLALVAGGVELKRRGWLLWRIPLYLVACLDLVFAAAYALSSSDALMVAVLFTVAVISFAMQWVEREDLPMLKLPPLLSYLGALAIFGALYFATRALNIEPWFVPVVIAAGGAAMVVAGLLLRGEKFSFLYSAPLRYTGLAISLIALVFAVAANNPHGGALTYAIAAVAFGADGVVRKQIGLVYAGGAAAVGAVWWLLRLFQISEWQGYAIPLGVLSLAIGWSEARQGRMLWFRLATIAGLVVLLGSAFYQSLNNISYAVLLLVESVAALAIGFRLRSRLYVEAGIIALFANGLAQFGPAFINLDRWIQIGTVGTILLLLGLVALFRRQRLLEVRQSLTSEWKMWQP